MPEPRVESSQDTAGDKPKRPRRKRGGTRKNPRSAGTPRRPKRRVPVPENLPVDSDSLPDDENENSPVSPNGVPDNPGVDDSRDLGDAQNELDDAYGPDDAGDVELPKGVGEVLSESLQEQEAEQEAMRAAADEIEFNSEDLETFITKKKKELEGKQQQLDEKKKNLDSESTRTGVFYREEDISDLEQEIKEDEEGMREGKRQVLRVEEELVERLRKEIIELDENRVELDRNFSESNDRNERDQIANEIESILKRREELEKKLTDLTKGDAMKLVGSFSKKTGVGLTTLIGAGIEGGTQVLWKATKVWTKMVWDASWTQKIPSFWEMVKKMQEDEKKGKKE